MCGRYFIDDSQNDAELHDIIESLNRRKSSALKTSGEIFPTDTVPVIANNRAMARSVFAMTWGYTFPNGKRIINARSETANEKQVFRNGMEQRRCVIPASNYFEWERLEKKRTTKYAIRPDTAGLMYMAGIYRFENGTPVFTILTREPAEDIAFIHDRMPVILPSGIIADWMNPRYKAKDIMKEAVLSVQYKPVDAHAGEQLHIDLI